jgi:hypothetical protein
MTDEPPKAGLMGLIAAAIAAAQTGQTTHGIVNGAADGWQMKSGEMELAWPTAIDEPAARYAC